MKKIFLILALILSLTLVACSTTVEETPEESITATDYSINDVLDRLLYSSKFPGPPIVYQLGSDKEFDADYLDYYFGDTTLLDGVSDYVFVTSPSTNVNEVGIFKITGSAQKEKLIKAFETRRDNLVQLHANYSAEDVTIAENMMIGSFDDVVYFIATESNAEVESLITNG